jgi:digeranylgeranylglycerophospholipid reductase
VGPSQNIRKEARRNNEMDDYDIAVIGAGPSGVMAAWKAANAGSRTVLLEREENPGRKVCAEGVLDIALTDAEIEPRDEFVSSKIVGAVLYAPDESKKVDVKGAGFVLDKPRFLSILAERARSSGAEIRYGATVEEITRDGESVLVSGKRGNIPYTLRCKIVVGCDGVASLLARRFFKRDNYSVVAALQYDMSNCKIQDESKLHIYVGHQKAPSGYIWIFPKGHGEANVGIGVKGSNAKQLLDNFVQSHPGMFSDAIIQKSLAAPVPVGGEVSRYVQDNMMLCGDAAGQVIPLTGAGIHTGIAAGKIAGEVAAKAVAEGNFSASRLKEYQERFDAYFGTRISNSLKALESFEKFSDDDLNIITEYLEGQDLVDMANGYSPTRAISLLVRHPLLAMKVAYQLLTS